MCTSFMSITKHRNSHARTSRSKSTIQRFHLSLIAELHAVNIIDEANFAKLARLPLLKKVQSNIYSYDSKTPILLNGSFHATVESQDRITEAPIFVAEGNSGSLLSYKTASELGLITIRLDAVGQDDTIAIESLEAKHAELFLIQASAS